MKTTRRFFVGALLGLLLVAHGCVIPGHGQGGEAFGTVPHSHNVRVVGYSEVDGRPPFKLAIQEVRGRWYLYMGHLWHRGWTIMDVTEPARPQVVNFLPGPANTWTIQMEVAEGKMFTALERIAAGWGGDPKGSFDEGVVLWDLSDPVHPRRLGQWKTGGTGTHRDFYAGGPYVHLTAGMPGYSGNIYVILDISTPASPREVGRWWVPGQHTASGERPAQPGISLHGPPYVVGNLAYLPYGAAGLVILDISDPRQPKRVGQLPFSPPFNPIIGAHSVLPLPAQRLAVVLSEAIKEDCQEPLNHASVVDVANPAQPVLRALFPVPVPPPGAPYQDFCAKGGRFGPHNLNQHYHSPFVQRRDDLIYVTYFTAGLRIFSLANPRLPVEVGSFLPPEPTRRYGLLPARVLTAQSEDVLVDARGYIYLTDKNQGLWILEYTGPGK